MTINKDGYSSLMKTLPHPRFEDMSKIPGRLSIITVFATLHIIRLQREILRLVLPSYSTDKFNSQIELLERHKEESSHLRGLTQGEKIIETQQRFEYLKSVLPTKGYLTWSQHWILRSGAEFIQNLEGVLEKLNFVPDCRGVDLRKCGRPGCPWCEARQAFLEGFSKAEDGFSAGTVVDEEHPEHAPTPENLPEPLFIDCWSQHTTKDSGVMPIDIRIRKWQLGVAIEEQMELERLQAVEEGRNPDIPYPGSLTSAFRVVNRAYSDTCEELEVEPLELLSSVAVMQKFTESKFPRGPDSAAHLH
ncbi:hypothetical protein D9758_009393 [Tetrapyrgos nigripes]|uniref:Uncharacterized protein n=1 Tax=Tetrapyrgos nigripes TaxID=182062 RepID=A0A8H5D2T8_9AGAR|nr:hypothetical protein D9758_009393 [Tetrapyrgos nigripes]